MATYKITGGSGNAPGYGKVTNPKPKAPTITPWGKANPNFRSASVAPVFTPAAPRAPTGPAVSAPAGPAGSTALPVDPLYDQTIAGLTRTKGDTLADLTRQRTSGLLGYGYTATYGNDGLVSGLAYDPNNPYSQAALARTVYQQSKTGTTNGMAARGQLYSGALINAQNQNDTNFNVGENGRQNALIAFLNGLTGQEKITGDNYDTSKLQAEGDRLGRAPTNPNYTPTTPDAAPAASPVSSSKVDLSKWVKTAYKNPQGHDVRVFGDGHKEVLVNGVWKRV